jgi:CheY-like chemotaxis protein/anti-sigma regulatory factor (Ser/Thr protein kinase)
MSQSDDFDGFDSYDGDAFVWIDLCMVNQHEAGKVTLAHEEFDLRLVLDSVHDLLSVKAREKSLQYVTEISPDIPALFCGDALRIRQILTNLIGNALKFTEQGMVKVGVTLFDQGSDTVGVEFKISDTGPGIPADRLSTIFEEFTQLDGSAARRHEGTGLGLAIVRRLSDLMNGQVTVESRPGEGSCFSFRLHLPVVLAQVQKSEKESDGALTPLPSPTPKATAPSSVHLLVAEDNLVNQKVATQFLKKLGITCDVVGNGREALAAMETQNYALVLMDVHMPEMDGLEATRRRRSHEKDMALPRLPIIALTADAIKGDREKCLDAGMDDYITKPIQFKILSDTLTRHL